MATMAETLKALKNGKPIKTETVKRTRSSKISARRYDIVGHRLNDTDIIHRNVSAVKANALRTELRRNGCYAVDKIEVFSKVEVSDGTKKVLTFSEKNYQPLLEGKIPGVPNVYGKQLEDERAERIAKRFHFQTRQNNSTEYRSDSANVIIFDKASGKGIYYGDEAGAVFFFLNKKLKFNEVVVYLPSKTVARMNRNDR